MNEPRPEEGTGGGGAEGLPTGDGRGAIEAYWRRNLRLVGALLAVWFVTSLLGAVLLAGPLNGVRIPGTGFRLGFWLAQQGSIYTFVLLIVVYVRRMNRLDREFGLAED